MLHRENSSLKIFKIQVKVKTINLIYFKISWTIQYIASKSFNMVKYISIFSFLGYLKLIMYKLLIFNKLQVLTIFETKTTLSKITLI